MERTRGAVWRSAAVLAMLACGCTPAQYAGQADQAAYSTVAQGQRAALGLREAFDVGYRPFGPDSEEAAAIRVGPKVLPLGPGEPAILTPEDCLLVAYRNARDLQGQKEGLYMAALDLAASRRVWDGTLVGGAITADASTRYTEGEGRTDSASAGSSATLARKFVGGGALALGASVDLASDLTGLGNTTVGSLLSANFTQPLLRGAWMGLAYEGQYRAERDFLFTVYQYGRFQESFAVSVVSRYYALLEAKDRLENEKQNLKRLQRQLEVARILVEGGQKSKREQDQLEQSVLQSEISLEQTQLGYRDLVDDFKLFLGLPMSAYIYVDYPGALKALTEAGPKAIPFDQDQAIEVAFSTRPDMLARRAALRDAERNLVIAADAFLPQLDLSLEASAPGRGPRDFWETQFHRHTRGASAHFNYGLDQTDNRNAYRKGLIALERARRDYVEFEDRVRLEVRQSHRTLLQSKRSYELQKRNVEVAMRLSRLLDLERRAGQASSLDVLNAEAGLLSAQNGLTAALVTYTTTRLQFLANLGMLRVGAGGQVGEREEPFRFDLIGKQYPYLSAKEPPKEAPGLRQAPTSRPAEGINPSDAEE